MRFTQAQRADGDVTNHVTEHGRPLCGVRAGNSTWHDLGEYQPPSRMGWECTCGRCAVILGLAAGSRVQRGEP